MQSRSKAETEKCLSVILPLHFKSRRRSYSATKKSWRCGTRRGRNTRRGGRNNQPRCLKRHEKRSLVDQIRREPHSWQSIRWKANLLPIAMVRVQQPEQYLGSSQEPSAKVRRVRQKATSRRWREPMIYTGSCCSEEATRSSWRMRMAQKAERMPGNRNAFKHERERDRKVPVVSVRSAGLIAKTSERRRTRSRKST